MLSTALKDLLKVGSSGHIKSNTNKNKKEEILCAKCGQQKNFLIKVKTLGPHYTTICLDCLNKKDKKNKIISKNNKDV